MRGLHDKFEVRRSDGRDSPKDKAARYFVLNYVGDPHARVAVAAYADAVEDDNPTLAEELRRELAATRFLHERWGAGHRCEEPTSHQRP